MSTRAQIVVEGSSIKLYKHCDGYPSEVLRILLPFVDGFMKHRGFDEEYLLARMVMAFGEDDRLHAEGMRDDPIMGKYADQPRTTGFGLDLVWHGDIAYAYVVKEDGSVEVHVPYPDEEHRTGSLDQQGKHTRGESSLAVARIGTVPLGTPVEVALKELGEE